VAAIPAPAKAKPISSAAGAAPIAQTEWTRRIASMTVMNASAYGPPRISAQPTSPSAISSDRIGVASAAS
jgi:hypothetical protein